MNESSVNWLRAGVLTLLLALPAFHGTVAQEVAENEDPPSRVARLSYRQGEVNLEPAGSSAPETALLNRPLTTGDRLWADEGARAELQVGSATLHLDESTGIEFTEVGDDTLRILLHDGAVNVHVRDLGRNELLEIETPNAIVTLDEPGEYRIEANADRDATLVKVRDGASTVDGVERGAGTYRVDSGRQGVFTGAPLSADIGNVDPRSAFDRWSADREQRSARSPTSRYVSREVIGYEDLDDHGDWRAEPEYGYVWYPRVVVAGWAPYRHGQWVWVRPWGWTWVDSSPWGFAPFHYGRWAYVHDRWGWVPGPRRLRPVYAPALVAWIGGPSVSVSVSFGSGIGWFPLGPREVYVPGYRASRRHITNVNVSNTVIVNNAYITNVYESGGRNVRYVHRDRRDAITAVSRDDFTRGRPVDRNRVRWADSDARIEANTLRPQGFRDAGSADRARGSVGRADIPRRATADRDNDRPRAAREQDGADSRQRDRGTGSVAESPPPATQPKETGRTRFSQPAVAGDKRERVRTPDTSENEDRGTRLRTAPDANNLSFRESAPQQPRTDRQQFDSPRRDVERRNDDTVRAERSREQERQVTETPRQSLNGQETRNPRGAQSREQRREDDPSTDRGRRDLSPQGQKDSRESGRGRQQ